MGKISVEIGNGMLLQVRAQMVLFRDVSSLFGSLISRLRNFRLEIQAISGRVVTEVPKERGIRLVSSSPQITDGIVWVSRS